MHARVQDNGESSVAFFVTNGVKQGCVLAPTFFSIIFSAMLFDAFRGSDYGIDIRYLTDCSVFNLRRLQAKTKVKNDIVSKFLFADDCALNAAIKANRQNSVDKFSMPRDNFGLTISTKKDRCDARASAWKTIYRAKHHYKGTTTEGSRKVHLPRQHPL